MTLVSTLLQTTPSIRVQSQRLSTQNIKNSDSSHGKRSTFKSGSLLCSTVKQHLSSDYCQQLVQLFWQGRKRMLMSDLVSFDLNRQLWTACLQPSPFPACKHIHIFNKRHYSYELLLTQS